MRAKEKAVICRELGVLLKASRGPMTLEDVSRATGLSQPTLSRLEHGNGVDVGTLARVCAWLGVSADALLFER